MKRILLLVLCLMLILAAATASFADGIIAHDKDGSGGTISCEEAAVSVAEIDNVITENKCLNLLIDWENIQELTQIKLEAIDFER